MVAQWAELLPYSKKGLALIHGDGDQRPSSTHCVEFACSPCVYVCLSVLQWFPAFHSVSAGLGSKTHFNPEG